MGEGVPDWPPLLVVFLLCWVLFAWTVAGVLYLASFPEKVAWLDQVLGRCRGRRGDHGKRYVTIENHSFKICLFTDYAFRRRKHSAGQAAGASATGLGISFSESPNTPPLRRPRSFDSESLEIRESKALYGGSAATAPLPSNGSFKMLSPDPNSTRSDSERERRREDLESGEQQVRGCDGGLQAQEQPEAGDIAGVLESINVLIDFVARYMARMASDRGVDGAERGLFLPVREQEREPAGEMV